MPPCRELAKQPLQMKEATLVRTELDVAWRQRHLPIRHQDVPTSAGVRKQVQSQCSRAGFCVCSRASCRGLAKAALALLRVWFRKQKKIIKPSRVVLDEGRAVLCMSARGVRDQYAHIGYLNRSTFELTLLPLDLVVEPGLISADGLLLQRSCCIMHLLQRFTHKTERHIEKSHL